MPVTETCTGVVVLTEPTGQVTTVDPALAPGPGGGGADRSADHRRRTAVIPAGSDVGDDGVRGDRRAGITDLDCPGARRPATNGEEAATFVRDRSRLVMCVEVLVLELFEVSGSGVSGLPRAELVTVLPSSRRRAAR